MKISKPLENIALIVFVCLVVAVFITNGISRSYMGQYTELLQKNAVGRLEQVAREASNFFEEEELDEFQVSADINSKAYRSAQQRLMTFARTNNVLFVYFIRVNSDGNYEYIIDNDLDPQTRIMPGQPNNPEPATLKAFDGKTASSTIIDDYGEAWDGLITSYSPVFARDGRVIAVVGVDIEDTTMYEIMRQNHDIQITFIIELIAVILVGAFLILVLRQRAAEFLEASQAKSSFLSRMSHEIRTPMNAIIGLSRMAWQSDNLNDIHNYLETISNSSTYLLSLLNNILDISKIEAGKMDLEDTIVRPQILSVALRTMLTPQAIDKSIALEFDINDDLPESFISDNTRLTQVLVNLMGNSLKFTPEGGMVALGVRELGFDGKKHHIEFCVKDTGIGIAKENIGKLFDPFEQADGGTTRKFGGTGLGLAITNMLVEMLGGKIKVESKLGEGSSFIFDIYARATSQEDEDSEESSVSTSDIQKLQTSYTDNENTLSEVPAEEMPDLSGIKLLIVEDNEINQMVAEDTFTRMGAEVVFANNGEEGLNAFLQEPDRFDIIFMDIQMPVMDGLEATRQIRSSGLPEADKIPIIAMTANVFAEDVAKTKAAGMDAHVGKPIEIPQIIAAIEIAREIRE